jgi:hypothetical protein
MRPVLALVALIACHTGAPDAAKTSDAARTSEADRATACAGKIAAMRALFADAPTAAILFNTPPGLELPATTRGVAVDGGLPLFVRADGSLELGARTHASVADARDALQEEFERAQTFSQHSQPRTGPRMLLVADRRTRATTIRELVDVAPSAADLYLVADLAGDTIPPGPPIPEAVRDILAEPVDQRAIKLAREVERTLGSCGAVREVFESIAASPADQRSKLLFSGLPTAVEKCHCNLDVDGLVAVVWTIAGKTEPDKRALALSRDPAVPPVGLPADATVADIIGKAEGGPLRLAGP